VPPWHVAGQLTKLGKSLSIILMAFLGKLIVAQFVKKFMKPEGSSPCLEKPAIGPS
jgi:hypothetical protein